ncbi:MAG: glycosyltransferase family 52 protein [Fusobacterium necrophorum]|nr:glycosyltransferase family 52 protein [Fusobacterium necrophorum]MDY2573400.1 glycosyltransferase family 52 [Fusobacterium necrophorum]
MQKYSLEAIKDMKYLCISTTSYNFLLFCLLRDFLENTIFWVSSNLYLPERKDFFLLSEADDLGQEKLENKLQFQKIKKEYFTKETFEIYAQDHVLKSYSFIKGKFFVIEDGTMTYLEAKNEYEKEKNRSFFAKWQRKRKGKIAMCGVSSKVEKLYLRGILPTPSCIQHKVEYIDIYTLWKQKSIEEKKWILHFFDFQQKHLELLRTKKVILFTQPLSEDGIMSEEEKIEIYRKILEKEEIKELVIKTHPRERTEYRKYFVDVSVLQEKTPFEIYLLHGLRGKKVITLFSTAVYGLEGFEVIFYGTKGNKSLMDRFGEITYKV